MSEKILVAVPVYNCQEQIARVIAQFEAEIQPLFAELLVIDNGSTDQSVERAISAVSALRHIPAKVIRNVENYSLGGSIKVAFNYCLAKNYDFCIILHGDDQADIRDIVPHLRSGEFRKWACMLGSRFDRNSRTVGYSWTRILGNRVLNLLVSLLMRRRVTDLGSGLNMYAASFLDGKFYLDFPNALTFDVYVLLHALLTQAPMRFFPISWREYDQKSNARPLAQALHILQLVVSCLLAGKLPDPGSTPWSKMAYASVEQWPERERMRQGSA